MENGLKNRKQAMTTYYLYALGAFNTFNCQTWRYAWKKKPIQIDMKGEKGERMERNLNLNNIECTPM